MTLDMPTLVEPAEHGVEVRAASAQLLPWHACANHGLSDLNCTHAAVFLKRAFHGKRQRNLACCGHRIGAGLRSASLSFAADGLLLTIHAREKKRNCRELLGDNRVFLLKLSHFLLKLLLAPLKFPGGLGGDDELCKHDASLPGD